MTRRTLNTIFCLALFGLFYVLPRPVDLTPDAWHLTGLFLGTILGLMLEPLPGGAVVLVSVTVAAGLKIIPLKIALEGYAESTVWLVLAAYFISRSLINTGLAKRIALQFVWAFGQSSLGVCYALSFSDLVLATIIPSIAARSGGVILPIARSISELYGSTPGATATRLGAFLMLGVYQAICVGAAMFLTGQASNPLVAKFAAVYGFRMDWASWLMAGSVPGLLSMFLVPWIVYRVDPPEVKRTPEARTFASEKLAELGPMSTNERIMAAVFALVCGGWITSGWTGLDITLVALMGAVALLITGVLSWEDIKTEKSAWDIFLWYGGLYMLGKALNDMNVTKWLATSVAGHLAGAPWQLLLAALLLFYFYAHYGFASITAHVLAMYPAFLALLHAQGAPIGLAAFSFAAFSNLSAGLTHYGTTPGPMFFSHGYVPMKTWWRVGLLVSFANILVWSIVGGTWWKVLGIW